MVDQYLNYLNKNMGVRFVTKHTQDVFDKLSDEQATLDESDNAMKPLRRFELSSTTTEAQSPLLNYEQSFDEQKSFAVLFLRITAEGESLASDSASRELFAKLRLAVGYDASTAPWIETSLGFWQEALTLLRPRAQRILLMFEDRLEKNTPTLEEWIIPDPRVMLEQVELKRPTWELLKDWKNHA